MNILEPAEITASSDIGDADSPKLFLEFHSILTLVTAKKTL
jgi:hypothetical protein